jgi:ElaB/YqjD/DUF883 family membrane-anchored ribosome-binding protein
MDTPQIDDALILLGQLGAAIIAISGALMIIRKVFFKTLCEKLEKINQELRPNGGTSLRDAVNRIEKNQQELKQEAKDIRKKVDDHIEWHLDK